MSNNLLFLVVLLMSNSFTAYSSVYRIINFHNQKLAHLGTSPEGHIRVYSNGAKMLDDNSDLWEVEWIDNEWIRIKNVHTGACLATMNVFTVAITPCGPATDSHLRTHHYWRWHNGGIQNRAGNMLDVHRSALSLSSDTDSPSQKWSFERAFKNIMI